MTTIKRLPQRLFLASFPLVWLLYGAAGLGEIGFLPDVLSPLLAFLAALALLLAGRQSKAYRPSWYLLAAAAAVWGLADGIWAVLEAAGRDPAANDPLNLLYLVPNLAILASFAFMAFTHWNRWTSVQFALDNTALLLSFLGLFYFAFLTPLLDSADLGPVRFAVSIAYILSDALILTLLSSVLVTLHPRNIPRPVVLVVAGALVYTVTDFVYVYQDWTGHFQSNQAIDILYMLSFALLGFAGAHFHYFPTSLQRTRERVVSRYGIINRSLLLLIFPLLVLFQQGLTAAKMGFFLVVLSVHQGISILLRGRVLRSIAEEENRRLTARMNLLIADRTRELEVMNQTLQNLIMRDEITGQFNRKHFIEALEKSIAEASEGIRLWFILVDFDRFKSINDTYGHDVGDTLLRVIGRRLETLASASVSLARLGGDEFGIGAELPANEPVRDLVHKIRDLIDLPVTVGKFTLRVTYSIGVACWPVDARTRSDLMRHADIALYEAKKNRSRRVAYFERETNAAVERRHQLDLALAKADFDREFSLVFQPQFTVRERRLVGAEALVRWVSPEFGPVGPDEFIPVAEENGVILPLSDWISRKAVGMLARWNLALRRDIVMGINISPVQFNDIYFFAKLSSLIDEFGVEPSRVNAEVTERTAMGDEDFVNDTFDRLSDLGIMSSIDDFGTGYSSLSYLRRYRIDYLKIAKQLVDGIESDEADTEIVQAIVSIAKALKLKTIAEGVETAAQLAKLEALGCDEIQGYYLGKPMTAEDFEKTFFAD